VVDITLDVVVVVGYVIDIVVIAANMIHIAGEVADDLGV